MTTVQTVEKQVSMAAEIDPRTVKQISRALALGAPRPDPKGATTGANPQPSRYA